MLRCEGGPGPVQFGSETARRRMVRAVPVFGSAGQVSSTSQCSLSRNVQFQCLATVGLVRHPESVHPSSLGSLHASGAK